MAAPCRRMASRSLLQFVSYFSKTAVRNRGFRGFSSNCVCRASLHTRTVTESAPSPWTLVAAVCLQRLPVITADLHPLEQEYKEMILQMELEKSVMSDHELRVLEETERMSRKQADDYDSDDEGGGDQEIVLAQDLEDTWEQKLKNFQLAPRVIADTDKDLTSAERCLANSLFLLAEQQVGREKMWLLPQTQWQKGETLRQTAERALASLPEADFKATFLGNAPCGVYKYKLPKAVRTESTVGIKVFFFKAILSDRAPPASPNFLWLKKSELEKYLKPAYMMKVNPFILSM